MDIEYLSNSLLSDAKLMSTMSDDEVKQVPVRKDLLKVTALLMAVLRRKHDSTT